jgi:hypothetical protein
MNTLSKKQEIQVRRQAQKHLRGIPARQNAAAIVRAAAEIGKQ